VKPELDTASALPEGNTAVARELGLEGAADDRSEARAFGADDDALAAGEPSTGESSRTPD
jgi:hypothetical protein